MTDKSDSVLKIQLRCDARCTLYECKYEINVLMCEASGEVQFAKSRITASKTDRIAALQARKPGAPHPFIDRGTYIRYFMISVECIEAQEGWVRAGRPSVGP